MSDDSQLEIAAVVETPEQLERLYKDKPQYWEWAAFASILVQRRSDMERLVEAHHRNDPTFSNRQVMNVDQLEALYRHVLLEMSHLVEKLEQSMRAAPFQRLFTDRDVYDDEPTPEAVTAAATIVTDFYRGMLLIARDTRGVVTRDDYVEVIEDIAHLVDRPLEGVDEFTTKLVGFIAMLPTLAPHVRGRTESHPMELEIDLDGALMKRIHRQLGYRRQPWRRWFWPW